MIHYLNVNEKFRKNSFKINLDKIKTKKVIKCLFIYKHSISLNICKFFDKIPNNLQ